MTLTARWTKLLAACPLLKFWPLTAIRPIRDISHFLSAIAEHWIFLMSGIASVLIGIHERVKGRQITNIVFWLIAVGCVFAASFMAWMDQRKIADEFRIQRDNAQAELKSLTYPKIVGSVVRVGLGRDESNNSLLSFLMDLRNERAPSVVEGWHMDIVSPSLRKSISNSIIFPELNIFLLDGSEMRITNFFAMNVAQKAIERGTPSRGWVFFSLGGISPKALEESKPSFILTCYDYLGRTNTFTADLSGSVADPRFVIPGVDVHYLDANPNDLKHFFPSGEIGN